MHIRQRFLEPVMRGDYENAAVFRERFQAWINTLWAEKDAQMGQVLKG